MVPASLTAIAILVLAILPGRVGESLYSRYVGADWRQQPWEGILRTLTFSLVGFFAYAVPASFFGWPFPRYVFAETISEGLDWATFWPLGLAYSGHIAGAIVVGALAAWLPRRFRWLGHPSSWDYFLHQEAPGEWALVQTLEGDTLRGLITQADRSVAQDDRDFIILRPERRNPETGVFESTDIEKLFVPGRRVYWVGIEAPPKKGSSDDAQTEDNSATT